LAAIFVIYAAGRLFDFCWGPHVFTTEIQAFATMAYDQFRAGHNNALSNRTTALGNELESIDGLGEDQKKALREDPSAAYRKIKQDRINQFHKAIDEAAKARADHIKDKVTPPVGRTWAGVEQDERAAAAASLDHGMPQLNDVMGRGIFDGLMSFET